MAFCDEFRSVAEAANLFEHMSLPADVKIFGKKVDADLTFVPAREVVDEPERERSPETPQRSRAGSECDFAQTAMGELSPRGRTTSWHSNATDFDDLTCPGAQAEQSEQYRQAVYGHMPQMQQVGYWNGMFAGASVATPTWSNRSDLMSQFMMPSGSTADDLETQAEELNRAAEMLMKAATQAHAQALQMEDKEEGSAVASAVSFSSPSATQKPRWSDWEPETSESTLPPAVSTFTTVMMRNLPNDYTREMLLDLLDSHGFHGHYNFIYLPIDFKRKAGLGYAFVNLATPEAAQRMFAILQGFNRWQYSSTKVLELAWGEPLQGLDAHIDRYRNSPVMHRDVPEKFKPLLFDGDVRVLFPPPTKRLQRPRVNARKSPEQK